MSNAVNQAYARHVELARSAFVQSAIWPECIGSLIADYYVMSTEAHICATLETGQVKGRAYTLGVDIIYISYAQDQITCRTIYGQCQNIGHIGSMHKGFASMNWPLMTGSGRYNHIRLNKGDPWQWFLADLEQSYLRAATVCDEIVTVQKIYDADMRADPATDSTSCSPSLVRVHA
jgi:hypothetical protein